MHIDWLMVLIITFIIIFLGLDAYGIYDVWTSKKFLILKIIQTVFFGIKIFAIFIVLLFIVY